MRTARNQITPLEYYLNLTNKESKIVSSIKTEELTIHDIIARSGVSYSLASKTLSELKSEGIISSYQDGHQHYYSISNPLIHALIT